MVTMEFRSAAAAAIHSNARRFALGFEPLTGSRIVSTKCPTRANAWHAQLNGKAATVIRFRELWPHQS